MTSTLVHRVMVDDSDNQVVYTGAGWFLSNSQGAYLHTLHGTNVSGSLSFSFQGTEVKFEGNNNQKNISGILDPQWECFVDEISIGGQNSSDLCGTTGLKDGHHKITLNVMSAGRTFWLDNIIYLPSPSQTFDHVTLFIDNHNPGPVFDSNWGLTSDSTAYITQTNGSTATFNFTGTRIDWFGIVPEGYSDNTSSAMYSIDGEPAILFDLKGKAGMRGLTLFSAVDLQAAPHTLLVTYLGGPNQMPLTFDYMHLSNVSLAVGTSTAISSSTYGPAISGTNSPSVPQQSSRGRPVGAIVGGVVGGTALLSLFIILLWWCRKRWAHIRGYAGLGDADTNMMQYHESEVTPYMYSASLDPTPAYVDATGEAIDIDSPPRYTKI